MPVLGAGGPVQVEPDLLESMIGEEVGEGDPGAPHAEGDPEVLVEEVQAGGQGPVVHAGAVGQPHHGQPGAVAQQRSQEASGQLGTVATEEAAQAG